MNRIRLFVYGTLLEEAVRRRVFGQMVAIEPALLPGWQVRARLVRGRYPGIVPVANAVTRGGLLQINRIELQRTDAYEAAPQLYRRVRVTVRAARERVRCWVYVPS